MVTTLERQPPVRKPPRPPKTKLPEDPRRRIASSRSIFTLRRRKSDGVLGLFMVQLAGDAMHGTVLMNAMRSLQDISEGNVDPCEQKRWRRYKPVAVTDDDSVLLFHLAPGGHYEVSDGRIGGYTVSWLDAQAIAEEMNGPAKQPTLESEVVETLRKRRRTLPAPRSYPTKPTARRRTLADVQSKRRTLK